MKVKYKMFRGVFASWEKLFTQASEFASKIGKDRVINISHSDSHSDGGGTAVVTGAGIAAGGSLGAYIAHAHLNDVKFNIEKVES